GPTAKARRSLLLLTTAGVLVLSTANSGLAEDYASLAPPPAGQTSNDAMLKKMEMMEQRIKTLEKQLKKKDPGATAQSNSNTVSDVSPVAPNAQAAPLPKRDKKITPLGPSTDPNKPILGLADSPVAGLSIGAYGEIKFGAMQNPAAG